jgi:undecaprenyl-diphosphatase
MTRLLMELDKWLLLLINSHHNSFWDSIMLFASGIINWFPVYIFLLFLVIYKFRKESWLLILLVIPLIFASDELSSAVLKPLVHRLRPSHEPGIEYLLHFVSGYRGGLYGFVSSHACNFFAVAIYLHLTASGKIRWLPFLMYPIVFLVIYSRIYLGVHYPSDVIAGSLLGALLGWLTAKIYNRFRKPPQKEKT